MNIRICSFVVSCGALAAGIGCSRVDGVKPGSDPGDAEAYAARASAWLNEGKYDEALDDYGQAIRLRPGHAPFLTARGFTWHMKGLEDKDRPTCEDRALSDYTEALRVEPKYALALNNRAWILATCKADRYRNGGQAVADARRACELTGWRAPGFLDTLSVAYAEMGDFEQAIRWERKALENPEYEREDGAVAREKLTLYSQQRPYRE